MGQNEQIITLVYETKWTHNNNSIWGQNEQIMTIVYETKWIDNDISIWDKMNR